MINPKKKAIYLDILRRFSANATREHFKYPFRAHNKIIATDASKMVALPSFLDDLENRSKLLNGIYPAEPNRHNVILLNELKAILANFPTVDCYDQIVSKCPACHGSGEVEFEFDYKMQNYTTDADCPVCDGTGDEISDAPEPNGKTLLDTSQLFMIANDTFNVTFIQDLVFVAEQLEATEIILVAQFLEGSRISQFKINEADVILMPIIRNAEAPTMGIGACIEFNTPA